MTKDLPSGWTWATLGEVGRYLNGRAFKATDWKEQGRPIIRIQNLTGSSRHHNHYQGEVEDRHLVRDGDLLLSWAATLGVFVWRGEEAVLNQHIFKVESWISKSFHRWLLQFVLDDLYRQAHGSGMVHITKRKFDATSVPIPPLSEQERIVAAIEEHFSRLDAVDAALTAAQRRLDALLRSVLRTMCEGPWPTRPLAQVITSLKNGIFVSRPSPSPPGHPIYRISAVRPLVLRVNDIRYARPVPDGYSVYAVEAGDILFTRYSGNPAYVGAAAVVPPNGAGVLHPDKLIRVIADRGSVLPEWIAAYVTAGLGRREVELRLKTTAGQVGISGSQLKSVPIAVPPISYQQHAVDKIWSMLAEQERMRRALSSAQSRIEALRRSVLAQAFSGQLVLQDPNDEPASVLLERVTASRSIRPERQKGDARAAARSR